MKEEGGEERRKRIGEEEGVWEGAGQRGERRERRVGEGRDCIVLPDMHAPPF